jgi:excisionase family DNA binding protein
MEATDALLTKPKTAEYLSITPRHLDYLVEKRRIPFVRVGRYIRFKPSDLDEWIEENRTEAL